jgi:hypothetical protein
MHFQPHDFVGLILRYHLTAGFVSGVAQRQESFQ